MSGFHLAGGSVNALALFLLGDDAGVVQILIHGGGNLEVQFFIDIHSIHLDKDGDVIGHTHHFILVHADPIDEGL